MTITAIAKELNTSTMTIYRRLKRAGVSVDELRDADTGELTTAGMSIIASLFKNNTVTPGATDDEQAAPQDATRVALQGVTGVTGDSATENAVTVAVLRAQLDAARDTIARLEAERDQLTRQLDAMTSALQTEQADRAQERLLLTDGQGSRRSWWARLWGKK